MIKYLSFLCLIVFVLSPQTTHAAEQFLPIEEIKTEQGLTAWLVTDDTLPLVSINFVFKGAGAKNNSADKQGTALLLSNMLDEGAKELDSQTFQKQLSDQSISLSFSTGRDNFSGNLTTLTRYQDNAFSLLTDALTTPRFDQEPFERMRNANLTRIKTSLGNPNWIVQRIFNDVGYEGHPYALNNGGTLTTLNALSVEDLKTHKHSYLTKDRLIIGVAGNITKEELAPILDNIFGQLPTSEAYADTYPFRLTNAGQTYLYKKDIPQSIIIRALDSIPIDDPDYQSLQILNYIFGSSGFGSRLMTEAREKRGLTYGIYSSLGNMDEINTLQISTSTDNKNISEMLQVIDQELENIVKNIEDQEIKDAKSYLIGSLPLSLTSTSQIAEIVTSLQLNKRPISYLDKYNERVNNVTKEDLMRVAERIFKDKSLLTVIVGQPEINTNEHMINIVKEIPNAE